MRIIIRYFFGLFVIIDELLTFSKIQKLYLWFRIEKHTYMKRNTLLVLLLAMSTLAFGQSYQQTATGLKTSLQSMNVEILIYV